MTLAGVLAVNAIKRKLFYEDEGSRIMAIHTGLSVVMADFTLSLDRDEVNKVAKVVVDGVPTNPISLAAVKVMASSLAQRAQRFLGLEWKIIEWIAPLEVGSKGA